jgi:thiamine-monophosphate kinase
VTSSEHERIRMLAELFGTSAPGFDLTLGDDCAVLADAHAGERIVWSVDAAVEGVHFRRDLMSLEDVGYRATMAALSDLAAMGARPLGVVGSLILPPQLDDDELLAISRGQQAAAAGASTAIVGGNLARGGSISITTSVLGAASRPILRSGARAGDALFVAGDLGWSAAGLHLAGVASQAEDSDVQRALSAFRRPRARLAEGVEAASAGATALIDVSDGLAADASHLALASDVTLVLEHALLRTLTSANLGQLTGRDPLDLVLHGGEDYALLATAPPDARLPSFTRIGLCVPRGEHSVVLEADGQRRPISAAGFDHFKTD